VKKFKFYLTVLFTVMWYARNIRNEEYGCPATGSISVNLNDNAFFINKRHDHRVRRDDTPMRELRNILVEQCVAHSPTPYSAKELYMQAIKM